MLPVIQGSALVVAVLDTSAAPASALEVRAAIEVNFNNDFMIVVLFCGFMVVSNDVAKQHH